MIVKVSMHTIDEGAPVTITEPHLQRERVIYRTLATRPLLARMRGKLIAYFSADISSHEIELGDEAPAQAW